MYSAVRTCIYFIHKQDAYHGRNTSHELELRQLLFLAKLICLN